MPYQHPGDEAIRNILRTTRNIAVVGLSPNPERPSHEVASYLKSKGYRIIPVNPTVTEVMGEKSYPSVDEIPGDIQVDVVDVFRRPEDVVPVAEAAVRRGAKVLWLQEGVVNEQAADIAQNAGLQVVMDRCMLKEHRRLMR